MGHSLWGAGISAILLVAAVVGCNGSSDKDNQAPEGGAGSANTNSKCTAGAARCDGQNVKICDAEGTAETIQATCLPSQACSDGACRETACLPNSRFCKGGAIWKCDSTGGGSALAKPCAEGYFCREEDGDATCRDRACDANEPMCDGNVATTCASDGSGPSPGGTDCAETKEACYEGICRDVVCTPGVKLCQHDDVYLCAKNGTDVSLFADCKDDEEVCDEAAGACRPKTCEPGKVECDGSRVVTCNEFGSAYLSMNTDCAASSSVCVEGSCRPKACTPNSAYCQDGSVFECDSTGTVSTFRMACDPQWYRCAQSPSNAYCASYDCEAGTRFCEDNSILTCTADGTRPDTGTACKDTEYCVDATCKPRGCELNQYFCKTGDVYYCGYYGAGLELDCPDQTACRATTSGAVCVPLPCEPGSAACLGNKVGTCAADGNALSKVTESCTGTTSICSAEPKCAKTVVDLAGVAETAAYVSPTQLVADVIEVTSARKVTELAMNLRITEPSDLRWVIYEQTGEVFTARVDKVVPAVTATGYLSSGAFTYSLKEGKRYLLGVAFSTGYGETSFDTAPFNRHLSFGTLLGRHDSSYQPTIDTSWYTGDDAYHLKITTEAP
jgi:hypothetical protein